MVGIAEDSVRFAHSGPAAIAVGGMESEPVPTEPGQTYPISAPTNNYIRKEDDYY